MGKYKNKITAVLVILAALTGAWFFGGNYNKNENGGGSGAVLNAASEIPEKQNTASAESGDAAISSAPASTPASELPVSDSAATPTPASAPVSESASTPSSDSTVSSASTPASTPASESAAPTAQTLDKYQTGLVPEDKPKPVEPGDITVGDDSFTVTLSVRCDKVLDNMNLLNKEKHELVPEDGVIFPATVVSAYDGESVFNILQREMRRAGIHMTFRNTPIYNSAYIEAINNIYEFDVGELSGWVYRVNDWFPNYGCSRYQLKSGDVIEWIYTCDLGRDLGEYWLEGGQLDE